jgi:hypothetical protein
MVSVVAHRPRLRKFEQARLLRIEDVFDVVRDTRDAGRGAVAQQRLDGTSAGAVLKQADDRQRQEREGGEDDDQFGSEAHGCHHF